MNKSIFMLAAGIITVGVAAIIFLSGRAEQTTVLTAVNVPELSAQAQTGKIVFDVNCAACHGPNAAGIDGIGPPLVHIIYEPNHHGDASFYLAVQNGVRAHHWAFGDMPPVVSLARQDVTDIIAYVRQLQRANGIN